MSVVTLRYAHAFGDVARSSGLDASVAQQQMRDFADTLNESPDLREFFGNPSIAEADKLRIVDAIVERIGVYPQVRNFIAVIIHHERLGEIEEMLAEYAAVADDQESISEASVTSARPLHDVDRAELETSIARVAGGRVHTTFHEDPALLGGAVVRIGSTVYDGSVRAQLERLRQQLVSA